MQPRWLKAEVYEPQVPRMVTNHSSAGESWEWWGGSDRHRACWEGDLIASDLAQNTPTLSASCTISSRGSSVTNPNHSATKNKNASIAIKHRCCINEKPAGLPNSKHERRSGQASLIWLCNCFPRGSRVACQQEGCIGYIQGQSVSLMMSLVLA